MIYRLDFDLDSYVSIFISMDAMEDVMDDIYYPEGESLLEEWVAPQAEFVDGKGQGRNLQIPDIGSWEGNMVLGPDAYEKLSSVVAADNELLPVLIDGQTWYVVNIISTTDAVNLEESEQDLRGGIYVGLKSLAFHEEDLSGTPLFKTSFDEKVGNFCNESFHLLVTQEYQLEGPVFRTNLERP
ncbi:hypothetical protein [Parendozoicomonas sp. Alg238-R29]|uniref:hypothetical protein n=1 Tax=Parendozoicomonas sp. Alg238-R29 TaxID=2993446 RepID=UPI00248EDB4C|nr:hypothetical protein [Parendozoicomonas sp. Alg238-R29]